MSRDIPLDPPLSPEEKARVDRLSESDIDSIDKELLSNVVNHWKKLARVVAETMNNMEGRVPAVPDVFYAQRVIVLAEIGLVESQGNLGKMRYSEVRLPSVQP